MYLKLRSFLIIIVVFVISCKNPNKQNDQLEATDTNDVSKENLETNIDTFNIDKIQISKQLQGKWREREYPYRIVNFLNTTVKFTEEGMESKPEFQEFELGRDCPFSTNNIKNSKSGTIIMILAESSRCEQLEISNDTLILSGYSTNTKKDYNILYVRSKE